jgi:hypothetical protein
MSTPQAPEPDEAALRHSTEEELRAAVDALTPRLPHWDERNRRAVQRLAAAITELVALRARAALVERAATETYMAANDELLLMAKGRALDRLIAAWERADHERAAGARHPGEGGETWWTA